MDIWIEVARCCPNWRDVVRIGGTCREVRRRMLAMFWRQWFVVCDKYTIMSIFMQWQFVSLDYNSKDKTMEKRLLDIIRRSNIPIMVDIYSNDVVGKISRLGRKIDLLKTSTENIKDIDISCFKNIMAVDMHRVHMDYDEKSIICDKCKHNYPNDLFVYQSMFNKTAYPNYKAKIVILNRVLGHPYILPQVETVYIIREYIEQHLVVFPNVRRVYASKIMLNMDILREMFPNAAILPGPETVNDAILEIVQ